MRPDILSNREQRGRRPRLSALRARRPGAVDAIGYFSEKLIVLGLGALTGVFIARHLGPADLGTLAFSVSVFSILAPVAGLGLQTILVREFALGEDWRTTLGSVLAVQFAAGAALAVAGLAVLAAAKPGQSDVLWIGLGLAPLPLLTPGESLRAYFEANRSMRVAVVPGVVGAVFATAVKVVALAVDAPVWVFAAATTVQVGVAGVMLARALAGETSLMELRRRFRRSVSSRLLREAWPLLISSVAVAVYMRVDMVMIGLMSDDTEVGIYSAAVRLSEVWYLFPAAIITAMRPRLSQLHGAGDRHAYNERLQYLLTTATFVAFGAIALVVATAAPMIDVLYGEQFAAAASVLRIHIIAVPFVFLGTIGAQWFVDDRTTPLLMRRTLVGALVNVVLNLALVPALGADGAAYATLAAYALSSVLLNATSARTRPLFRMQIRALTGRRNPPAGM